MNSCRSSFSVLEENGHSLEKPKELNSYIPNLIEPNYFNRVQKKILIELVAVGKDCVATAPPGLDWNACSRELLNTKIKNSNVRRNRIEEFSNFSSLFAVIYSITTISLVCVSYVIVLCARLCWYLCILADDLMWNQSTTTTTYGKVITYFLAAIFITCADLWLFCWCSGCSWAVFRYFPNGNFINGFVIHSVFSDIL